MNTDMCAGLLRKSCREPNGPASEAWQNSKQTVIHTTMYTYNIVLLHVKVAPYTCCVMISHNQASIPHPQNTAFIRIERLRIGIENES